MNDLVKVAAEVQGFCERRQWSFCIIGGLALQFWGENRLTLDADFTLLTGVGEEASFIDPLLSEFVARIADARNFALVNRVLLLESNGIGVDMSLGATEFEAAMVSRSGYREFLPNIQLRVCTPEDLIV